MKRVILVHGWASPFSGRYDIDKLEPYFLEANFDVRHFDYGFHFVVTPSNPKWAAKLASMIRPGDTICAHSNGNEIARICALTAPVRAIAMLNPAMDEKATFGPDVERVGVFYTPFDLPVRFGSWLPFSHPWGSAGVNGVTTGDPRVRNYNMEAEVRSHLGIFSKYALTVWAPQVVACLE